ncbi:hypothetical protein Agabi119p4_2217 [Agaricus bisporus var. burnettii]|uniref:Uncharacterized protein n=1 Tax=Agaricus bisporus var. burnettii TaxID=192524 RepID=A0A8H7F8N3_AGABI|nr:hypothetical protein Agabi119p4_2217 [Agaricus bisporus var. burnettii]
MSYEKALSSFSEEEIIKEQEEITKFLEEPGTVAKFSEACKNIGQTAVAIDENFRIVQKGFADIVEKYGKDFPEVGNVYVPQWNGYMARWNGETGMLWSSRKLAAETAAALTDYGINLGLIADIQSPDDLEGAKLELEQYVEKHPVHIAKTVAEDFENLKTDIQGFSKDFTAYIEEQKQKLTEDAERFEAEIKQLQETITKLNVEIVVAVIALGCSFALGIVEGFLAIGPLLKLIADRIAAQRDLNTAQANLKATIEKQKALAAMQADFEKLKPNIDDICTKLGVFADIWTFATDQSAAINTELQEGMEVLTRKKFQTKLHLLMAQIEPLKEGMRQYASQIVPPS